MRVPERATAGREAQQLVFRWSERNLLGGQGMGPVASSLPDRDTNQGWHLRLKDALVSGTPAGPPSLWFRNFEDGHAVVLHRRPGDRADGRGASAHALIGPRPVLTPAYALGLAAAGWWDRPERAAESHPLAPVDLDALRGDLTPAERLDAMTAAQPRLGRLVAEVLRAPGRPLSVVVAPGESEAQPALLWGLYRLLRDVLTPAGVAGPPGWSWSFSTFEAGGRDGARLAPHIDFRPVPSAAAAPSDFGQERRRPLDLGSPDPRADDCAEIADLLLECYRAQGADGLRGRLEEHGVLAGARWEDRQAALRGWLERARSSAAQAPQPPDMDRPAQTTGWRPPGWPGRGTAPPAAAEPAESAPPQDPRLHPGVQPWPGPPEPAPSVPSAAPYQPPSGAPAPRREPRIEALLAELEAAATEERLTEVMAEFRRRAARPQWFQEGDDRERARSALFANAFHGHRLVALHTDADPHDGPERAKDDLRVLVDYCVAPSTSDPSIREQITDLLGDPKAVDELVEVLLEQVPTRSDANGPARTAPGSADAWRHEVAAAVGPRWLIGHDRYDLAGLAPPPRPDPGPPATLLGALPPWAPLAIAFALGLVLGVVVMLVVLR
ncbi:hypothetical protein [Allonocardiopsis opalescens]|uniref:hypothetical protein n=1 Tax=Allonocardiopsis opalescens TaxID=1144618 RepID=UPI0011B27CFB|nr:hypothetical protein [Allonocardiopsis opalescens]